MTRRPAPEFQDRFLETPEVAALIRVSQPALEADRWTPTLGIPYYKIGSRVRYRLSEVLAWAESRRVPPIKAP